VVRGRAPNGKEIIVTAADVAALRCKILSMPNGRLIMRLIDRTFELQWRIDELEELLKDNGIAVPVWDDADADAIADR
jgi:hypothetical protein